MDENDTKRNWRKLKGIRGAVFAGLLCVLFTASFEDRNTKAWAAMTEEEFWQDDYLTKNLKYVEAKDNMLEELSEGYDDFRVLNKDILNFAAQKNGKWGIVSVDGKILVPFKYERVSYIDKTGWVEFEINEQFFVYTPDGKLKRFYSDKMKFRMEAEDGTLYRTGTAYMAGMQIETTIPEILGTDYYGIRYSTINPQKVLYEAVGSFDEAGIFTFPDETGRAVAIRGDGVTNTIYYITEAGCESRSMELPEGIGSRRFYFLGDYTWADYSLSNGWLKVGVKDTGKGDHPETEFYYAFLNVDTLELVRFPEKYQAFEVIGNSGYGDVVLLRKRKNEEDGKMALIKGNKILTKEIYDWAEYTKKYILAGKDGGVDILDYEGNVLACCRDVGGTFINGRMLIVDETGAFFIDENLQSCSEYLVTGPLQGCFAYGVIADGRYYPVKEFNSSLKHTQGAVMDKKAQEEDSQDETNKEEETEKIGPLASQDVPVELIKVDYYIYQYIGKNVYITSKDDRFGMVDGYGNELIGIKYIGWVYSDDEWIVFVDDFDNFCVHDYQGNLLYRKETGWEGLKTESGQVFDRLTFFRSGMLIYYDSYQDPEYMALHYYNAATGELIFEVSTEEEEIQNYSLPDETGMALVVTGGGFYNTMYRISLAGVTAETIDEPGVELRTYLKSRYNVLNMARQMGGWWSVRIRERRGELLDYSKVYREIFFNIKTMEIMPLPEKYQRYAGRIYHRFVNNYYAISGPSYVAYKNGESEEIYYAVCHESEVLTDEIYLRIYFDGKYIIAGNEQFAHILDYEGNVLAEFKDVAFPFIDGRTLVADETGAFYIDENLQPCTGYILKYVDFVQPNYIRKGSFDYRVVYNGDK